MDFPRGAEFWQILWIILFTKSNYFYVSYPPLLITLSLSSVCFFFLFRRPIFGWFCTYSCLVYCSVSSSPSFMIYLTFLLYSWSFFGFSMMTGSIGFSSSLGSSTFSTTFFDGGSFLILAAEGGLYIFFFYCLTYSSEPPPPKIFLT